MNANIPEKLCSVKYPDFNKAVEFSLKCGKFCKYGKSDMRSAFRNLGWSRESFRYLLLKARSPIDKKWYYFLDKCVSFGSSISCAHFQFVSDAVAFIVKAKSGSNDLLNYLDDYLFIALIMLLCNNQIDTFLNVCQQICFPVALEENSLGHDPNCVSRDALRL